MKINNLGGRWRMRRVGEKDGIPARVPGTVYTDLMENGQMEDPFYRDNEKEALKAIEYDYEYETAFDVLPELTCCDSVLLCFEGIDTLATVALNGRVLGKTDNMHRVWEFPVKGLLREQGNELKVTLHSPTKYIAASYEKAPIAGCVDAMRGLPRLRKAHCMFGWDWGPRIPDAGIFRQVVLLGIERARIDNVYVAQAHEEGRVRLSLRAQAEMALEESGQGEQPFGASGRRRADRLSCRFTLFGPEGEALCVKETSASALAPEGEAVRIVHSRKQPWGPLFEQEICVENPQLWWANGYGSQPLYRVRAELLDGDGVLDCWERRIGLRTMTVRRRKDEYGESFAHEVNGVEIFGMGADYIPEDNILSRVTKERTYRLLKAAHDACHNIVRVWGGGYYPDDFFYDACDELGLIVWQDFMYACCVYDLTEDFEASITAETIDNIKRIRHHASLGLWCGNNEMEMFLAGDREGWCHNPIQYSDYIKMFEYLIPHLVKEYDPQTFYWPASPSSGGGFDAPNDENRGDVHYWDVWHGGKPITEYRKFYFRYVSEFGFQSFPGLKTVETFTEPEDRNIFSYVMEKHQRNAAANGRIMDYMEQTYLYPGKFDTILYASQLLQAEAIRYGVEHFRRNRGRCMGTVVWQLNDCWPSASWSSIDYYGRWKALHYFEKRFFAPLLLSCLEEGMLSQNPNVNAQPYEVKKSITLCASNETMQERRVTVFWELRGAKAEILRSESRELVLAPLSSCWMEKVELPEAKLYENYVSYRLEEAGEIRSAGTGLFCAPKYFRFQNPNIRVEAQGDELIVTAESYAKGVCILNGDDTMLLDDNYFDMNAGSRRIRVLEGKPENLQVKSVFDIGRE